MSTAAQKSRESTNSGTTRCLNLLNDRPRIELQDLGEFDQFNDINPALAAFQACDEGLVLTEPSRKVCLRHSGPFPGCNKQFHEYLVTWRP